MNTQNQYFDKYINSKCMMKKVSLQCFIAYKSLFETVYNASLALSNSEYKTFLKQINLSHSEANDYCLTYIKLFHPEIKQFNISEELIKQPLDWRKDIWIAFAKMYNDDLACRKLLFNTLIGGKLLYNNVCIPVDKIKLSDLKNYKLYLKKYKTNKAKNVYTKFKFIRTRLTNFLEKELNINSINNSDVINKILNHYNNFTAMVEEHLESSNKENNKSSIITQIPYDNTSYANQNLIKFTASDLFKSYLDGKQSTINWDNPYYSVIFMGLDIFNLPTSEEYKKIYTELSFKFQTDDKNDSEKSLFILLQKILLDINFNIWGINGEKYPYFVDKIRKSLIRLGVE